MTHHSSCVSIHIYQCGEGCSCSENPDPNPDPDPDPNPNPDPDSPIHVPLGMIQLMPFTVEKLPTGWHVCNGGSFAVDTAQGQALIALDSDLRAGWNIAIHDDLIFKPNLLTAQVVGGEGYFFRPSSCVSGTVTGDAIRNMTGSVRLISYTHNTLKPTGPFEYVENYGKTGDRIAKGGSGGSYLYTNVSAYAFLPTAVENRPFHVAMTPAIYLGV